MICSQVYVFDTIHCSPTQKWLPLLGNKTLDVLCNKRKDDRKPAKKKSYEKLRFHHPNFSMCIVELF